MYAHREAIEDDGETIVSDRKLILDKLAYLERI